MSDPTTHADIAVSLAEIKKDLGHLRSIIGDEPDKGLRGEVAMLIGIKNKGWGLVVGLLIFAGAVGASIKSAIGDLLLK
jgi:hypothetical protein